jgi:hypothetical protein
MFYKEITMYLIGATKEDTRERMVTVCQYNKAINDTIKCLRIISTHPVECLTGIT